MFARMRRPSRAVALRRVRIRIAAVLLAGVAAVAGPLALPASADPSDQPGGTTAVFESEALDDLQTRAGQVQDRLKAQQSEAIAAVGSDPRALERYKALEARRLELRARLQPGSTLA